MYTAPLADIIWQHGLNFNFYADDMQIYLSFNPKATREPMHSLSRVQSWISDITNWMTSNKLMLNSDKTEFLLFNACHCPRPLLSITVGRDVKHASHASKNIGVWFDEFISMDKQVKAVCKSAFFNLCNIAKVRKYLSFTHCKIWIHAFITSKLDYCNSLLSGLRQDHINKLQLVQNSAAHILTGTRKHEHISPILRSLHWLPILARIDFKLLLLTFKFT